MLTTKKRIWVNFTRNGLRLGSRHQEPPHTDVSKEFGYSCRIPLVKPLLNHRQRQRRLTWAKEKKNWTVAQWSKVLFSDERTEPILPIRRIRICSPETPGGPLALKDVLILVSILNLASCCENMNDNFF